MLMIPRFQRKARKRYLSIDFEPINEPGPVPESCIEAARGRIEFFERFPGETREQFEARRNTEKVTEGPVWWGLMDPPQTVEGPLPWPLRLRRLRQKLALCWTVIKT